MSEGGRYLRTQRLGTTDVVALLSGGRMIRRSGFSVSYRPNDLGIARLGLIVPKRVLPRAVDRNRIKRMLREWFRCTQARLGHHDILVRVTKRSIEIAELEQCLAGSPWAEC